ncbi:MAG: SURF1 family protein, partial [Asticcacaulis sp.]|nr:SURF1 family protein [Asticcacaulis sp.]
EFVVLDLKASHLSVPGLEQGELIAPLTNRHLEYALTWFGLATALLGVYIGVVVQRMRQIKPE